MATPGIRKRHSRSCASRDGRDCNCQPSWEARVWSRRAGRDGRGGTISKSFPTYAAAKGWREDASHANRRGKLRRATRKTVREALVEVLDGMKDGSIRSARRKPYRPSTVRSYERATGLYPEMRQRAPERICDRLGDLQLSELTRHDVQDYVERLASDGWDASTIHNQLDVLRCAYRRARQRDEVGVDPLDGLDVPDADGRRDRAVGIDEAERLIRALPDPDRALWATYLYAGLRRGEARALRVRDVDLDGRREIHVARVWDDMEGELDGAKTDAGTRAVPIFAPLAEMLVPHLMATGRRARPDALVFGRDDTEPFVPSTVRRQALDAWAAAGLEPISPHECRHSCGSIWISALKITDPNQVKEWMGHSSIVMTFDHYGHELKGARERAVAEADAAWAARQGEGPALRAVE
jgi:integrase